MKFSALNVDFSSLCPDPLWCVYTIQQTSIKLPANVFKIHVLMLDVCWTFAESCKHPITYKEACACERERGVPLQKVFYRYWLL